MTAQPHRRSPMGTENENVAEIAEINPAHETNGVINATGTSAKDDSSSGFSERFDNEAGQPDEFRVPREPDRPERTFREFKGRHIQMMALGKTSISPG